VDSRANSAGWLHGPAPAPALARPGHNCWRVERAARVGFLIDGENYYRALADAFARAEREIAIVGWDVNSRARLGFDGGAGGWPVELGAMLDALARRRSRLHAWVLEWDFPMLYALDRELLPLVRFGWRTHRRVHFRLDSSHPLGGSQHQKIVIVDDRVAFVGGMDVTHGRWDTREHLAEDPRRTDPWGRRYSPYHDVQVVCDGAAAAALGQLARERWKRAGGRLRRPVRTDGDPWPACVRPDLEDVDLAIARTEPAYAGRAPVLEIANAWLDLLGAAKCSIYIENQYLTSAAVGDALEERLTSADCPEIVIVLTHASSGWLEEATMGVLRARLLERLRKADRCDRLRVYYACAGAGVDVKMHAKLIIVDDEVVRIGSANLNNRSMGLDSECDVFIEARGRADVSAAIAGLRDDLLGEHLGVAPDAVRAEIARRGSIGAAIEALRGGEHTLVPLEAGRDSLIDTVIPDVALIDPERPVGMNDLVSQLASEDVVSLRAPLEWSAIVLAAAAGVGALWYAIPLSERVDAFAIDAWLAPWRDNWIAPLVAGGVVALGGISLAPLSLLVALCGFVFGPWIGFAAAFTGAVVGAAAGYAVGFRVRRDTVHRLVGRRAHVLSRQLRLGGLHGVLAARLLSTAPFGAVNLVAGATRFPLRDFLLGTLGAIAPGTVALVVLGHAVGDAIGTYGSRALAGATAIALAVIAALLAVRRQIRVRTHEKARA
jgi:phosphatidylserine/phosphatidylglycerophosphate/cardiolipin synthase-like enzyme/uncharacterized membrane protein YdjX (TVP38/TMEM64 family)